MGERDTDRQREGQRQRQTRGQRRKINSQETLEELCNGRAPRKIREAPGGPSRPQKVPGDTKGDTREAPEEEPGEPGSLRGDPKSS